MSLIVNLDCHTRIKRLTSKEIISNMTTAKLSIKD